LGELGAQEIFENLTGRAAWKRADDLQMFGQLVARELPFGKRVELFQR